jgi:hypothetical protein
MPRKSANELGLTVVQSGRFPRLTPPSWLPLSVKKEFLDTVNRAPAEQFLATDAPLLCRYAECLVLARRALSEGDIPLWMQLSRLQGNLSVRLRLAPSSRDNSARTASKKSRGISAGEFLDQMGDGDADE